MGTEWTEERLDAAVGSVPVRIYRDSVLTKSPPLVLHLHGGAFLNGSLATGQLVSTLLAKAGAVVVSADYSSAYEHPFPAALQLSFDIMSSLCKRRAKLAHRESSLFVAGEEAGGNLAAGVALMARDQHLGGLQGQILLSPMLDPCMATGSFRKAEAGASGCRWADGWNRYLGFAAKACHPYAAPAHCMRLAGVAPALVLTAEDDPMHDESLNYARRLREAGVVVREHVLTVRTGWPGAYGNCLGVQPEWGETVCGHFAAFFHETGALSH
ncbi:alpha/beta hydrolase [Chelativorans xinjiangense]|uniref:alpha/beta hydrolase n=1 Tax=Chelativorans xinjiangense TaxID=2681485 RepID=UPI001359227B|nr:alpha/beta hydrolase [Chelativorans xinjiangense]